MFKSGRHTNLGTHPMNFARMAASGAASFSSASRVTLVAFAFASSISAFAQADLAATAAKEKGATVTPSGLVYLSLKDGTGPSPAATDTVKVHYRGTFADGKEFDSHTSATRRRSFHSTV
jgi:FKBP-type peptidyl-prolyl cis-trans isomerase